MNFRISGVPAMAGLEVCTPEQADLLHYAGFNLTHQGNLDKSTLSFLRNALEELLTTEK